MNPSRPDIPSDLPPGAPAGEEVGGVGHMTPEDFRACAREVVELILDYQTRACREGPVMPRVEPGEVRGALPTHPPERGEPWSRILEDVREIVLPGLMHWQSPDFYGYFPANASEPAILADLLCSGLGVQGMLWQTSPACTEIETRVMDWLGRMIGLPDRFLSEDEAGPEGRGGGVIQGTASEAVVVAMHTARHRAAAREADAPARGLVAYCSDQAHSSVAKAAMITGVGEANVRTIESDAALAMRPEALAAAIAEDRAAGRVPFFVCATLGTTSTGAFDPLEAIGRVIEEDAARGQPGWPSVGAWLHVDAAWAGAALVCPEHRWMLAGAAHADSFNFNPHKWLLTNFDCSALWVADRHGLVESLSITPAYLRNRASDEGAVIDYRDWQIPLGRRFRALKLWFVIRHYGVEGLRAHIRAHVGAAEVFESLLRADDRFEMPLARSLTLVPFRLRDDPDDARLRALVDGLNASGEMFLITTRVPLGEGRRVRTVGRFVVGATRTTEADVRRAWARMAAEADRVCQSAG